MAPAFLDTNILLRHLRRDDPVLSPKATEILASIERGEILAHTSDIVVFEAVFTLQSSYKVPREQIAAALLPLIELPGIVLPGKRQYRKVFDLYLNLSLGFADCYHLVLMQRLGLTEVLSFDADFDKVAEVRRRES